MDKEENLKFLQKCMEKVNRASAKDIQFYKDVYKKDCVLSADNVESSIYEFYGR